MTDDGDILSLSDTSEDLFGLVSNDFAGTPIETLLSFPDGTADTLLDCLVSLPPKGSLTAAKGKVEGGNPPMLQLFLPIGGDPRNPARVVVEAVPCDEPHSVEFLVWSSAALEGMVSIDAAGRIVDAGMGAALLLGYRESELVGNDVTVLMPSKIGRHHAGFLSRFKDAQSRRMVGTRRVVDAMHRDGSLMRVALEVSDADPPRGPLLSTEHVAVFTARIINTLEECTVYPKAVSFPPKHPPSPPAG